MNISRTLPDAAPRPGPRLQIRGAIIGTSTGFFLHGLFSFEFPLRVGFSVAATFFLFVHALNTDIRLVPTVHTAEDVRLVLASTLAVPSLGQTRRLQGEGQKKRRQKIADPPTELSSVSTTNVVVVVVVVGAESSGSTIWDV
ncbi:hypothetical protein F2P81_024359 [Scophthalmus maximus]|uniref:Uncharacterized protein n=1 Tax=Scophthalmus maximus TaxID=52904 RepID=A0A6A4RTT0_SCOMX|nr:hypothetical protein F2P81_024359 [Scophthalmus maximus]